jgi:putative protease
LGVKRIVLARELSLAEIKEIKEKVPGMELEVFVHGAMCMSYSGRCLLGDYMNGRPGNK